MTRSVTADYGSAEESPSLVQDVTIESLGRQDMDRWDRFVNHSPEATFFHRAGWKDVLEQAFGHKTHYLFAQSRGKIVGILPLAHIRSYLFGNALISTPFCVYGGVVSESPKVQQLLETKASELADQLDVDYLELRQRYENGSRWPTKDLYVTFRKSIHADPDENMLAIPRKQRAMVRKGIKAGLNSEVDPDIERFYPAYSESVRNLGTPVLSARYFRLLKEVFREDCEVLTVVQDGKVVCAVMSFYFKNEILPYYGGGTLQARRCYGNDFMYWEVMRRACGRGVTLFDYGRSKQGTGSYSFKKNWGFEPQPLFYKYHLVKAGSVPDINPLNPKYRMFINAWKRLPVGVSRFIGPFLAKSLG